MASILGDETKIGKISFNSRDILGLGSCGSIVYQGLYENRFQVAIKRIIKQNQTKIDREIGLFASSTWNAHLIRYYCNEQDNEFTYIVTERGDFSLEIYIEGKLKPNSTQRDVPLCQQLQPPLTLEVKEILEQCVKGLEFIHSFGYVHRNIKPSNYIICRTRSRDSWKDLVKISDFGWTKPTRDYSEEFSLSQPLGTEGWIPKEILQGSTVATTAVDVFALGCIFHYVLTEGHHPFGKPLLRSTNIFTGTYDLSLLCDELARDLVERMIQEEPEHRLKLDQVISHDYFLSDSEYYRHGIHPGLCVIINQKSFYDSKDNRPGTDGDRDLLAETFSMFGYKVEIHENLPSDSILSVMKAVSSRDFTSMRSLIVCLLSHGDRGTIRGVDNLSVKIDDLKFLFRGCHCPSLVDKPKIFIIQACQGEDFHQGLSPLVLEKFNLSPTFQSEIHSSGSDTTYVSDGLQSRDLIPLKFDWSATPDIPDVSDFLQAYSTVEGFVALRSITKGAIFIGHLCDVLRTEGHRRSLNDVLVRVNNKVSEWQTRKGIKQMPEIRSCLRKHLQLKRQESGFIGAALSTVERHLLDRIIELAVKRQLT